jgi:hypothetical protein
MNGGPSIIKAKQALNPDPRLAAMTPPYAPQAAVAPAMSTPTQPQIPTSAASRCKFNSLIATYIRSKRLNAEIDAFGRRIDEADRLYVQLRVDLAAYIDNDLSRLHKEEIQNLHVKHVQEVAHEKERYKELKEEHKKNLAEFRQQQATRVKEQEAIQRKLDIKLKRMPKDEIIDVIFAQQHVDEKDKDVHKKDKKDKGADKKHKDEGSHNSVQ